MPRRKACRSADHVWKRLRGGRFEKCEVCKITFPCRGRCLHADCCYVKGVEPPEGTRWVMAMVSVVIDTKGLAPWSKSRSKNDEGQET